MTIDLANSWPGIALAVVLLAVHTAFDLRLAPTLIKWFHWIPTRHVFRAKWPAVAGRWEEQWTTSARRFSNATDRHSHPVIRQFGPWCHAEFTALGVVYVLFGRIKGNYLCGDWNDKRDPNGYFGTFQLRIIDANHMDGKFLGHSAHNAQVRVGKWTWNRIPQ